MTRPICPVCRQRPLAVNYLKEGQTHYRSRCEHCIKKNRKLAPPEPKWKLRGYKKKTVCDVCKFKSRYTSQIIVYHMDGNLNNVELTNLRSICRNCVEAVMHQNLPWRRGDLEPDF